MVGPPPLPSPLPHGRASSARGSYTPIIPPVCRCGCQWTGRAGRIIASLNDCYSAVCCYRPLIWSHYIYQRGARALRGEGGPHRRFTNSCSSKRERNKKTDPPHSAPHPRAPRHTSKRLRFNQAAIHSAASRQPLGRRVSAAVCKKSRCFLQSFSETKITPAQRTRDRRQKFK